MKKTQTSPRNGSSFISRRKLLSSAVSFGALGTLGAGTSVNGAESEQLSKGLKLKKGAVILFQGDSVTDEGRKKDRPMANDVNALGKGYAAIAAGELFLAHPGLDLQVYNRGISGNKVPDLAARWQADAIELKPSVLSILVGINDLWHTIAFGNKYKGTIEDYEKGLRDLILRSQKEIPGVHVVLCEPFTLRDWPEFDPYRKVAAMIADELKLTFVPFQSVFDEATKAAPSEFWLWDGIHPSVAGHALMASTWRKHVGI